MKARRLRDLMEEGERRGAERGGEGNKGWKEIK